MNNNYNKGEYPWNPDKEDGTYVNPVLFADYSDPDVIRVGDYFYLTASSFNQSPGLPVLRSTDLVNWEIISNAITQPPGDRFLQVQPGCGVWAPAIRYHDEKFWIFFPMPDEGIFVTTAEKPEGPWCKPWLLQKGKGLIDPCPLWEDDGSAWLIFAYAKSRCGIKNKLHIRPMSADGKRLTNNGKIVYDGTVDHPTLEGPKLHKIGKYYYISAPAGGVPYGWQVILRSKHIYGPYDESKIVLEQNGSCINGPHQGALVNDKDNKWWFIHFQEHQPYGRICHLQPVTWNDGWPNIGVTNIGSSSGKPVLFNEMPTGYTKKHIPQTSDDFSNSKLGLQWAFQGAAGHNLYSLTERKNYLRLYAGHEGKSDLFHAPHVLVQKTPARQFLVETEIDLKFKEDGLEAGLAVVGMSSFAIVVSRIDGKTLLRLRHDGDIVMTKSLQYSPIVLVLSFGDGGNCQFGIKVDHNISWFGPVLQAKEGKWIGTRIALFCSAYGAYPVKGYADFSYFRFSKL